MFFCLKHISELNFLFPVPCPAWGPSSHCFQLAGHEGVCNLSKQSIPFPALPNFFSLQLALFMSALCTLVSGLAMLTDFMFHCLMFDSYCLDCLALIGGTNIYTCLCLEYPHHFFFTSVPAIDCTYTPFWALGCPLVIQSVHLSFSCLYSESLICPQFMSSTNILSRWPSHMADQVDPRAN